MQTLFAVQHSMFWQNVVSKTAAIHPTSFRAHCLHFSDIDTTLVLCEVSTAKSTAQTGFVHVPKGPPLTVNVGRTFICFWECSQKLIKTTPAGMQLLLIRGFISSWILHWCGIYIYFLKWSKCIDILKQWEMLRVLQQCVSLQCCQVFQSVRVRDSLPSNFPSPVEHADISPL